MIELFFANDRNQITFPDIVALRSKAKKNVLIDHRTVLAEVEFFHSIDLRVVDEERIAGSQNRAQIRFRDFDTRSEEHTSELQSQSNLVCRLLLEKKKKSKKLSTLAKVSRSATVYVHF